MWLQIGQNSFAGCLSNIWTSVKTTRNNMRHRTNYGDRKNRREDQSIISLVFIVIDFIAKKVTLAINTHSH